MVDTAVDDEKPSPEAKTGLRARVRDLGNAGRAVSRLSFVALRKGVLPAGWIGLRVLERDVSSARALLPLVARLPRGNTAVAHRLLSRALDDLATGFRRETDLTSEADNLVEFRKRLQRNPRVVVPLCYRELCRPNVLVM